MIPIRVVSTVALLCYVVLTLLVSRDMRRSVIRSFVLFLIAMLFWQVEVMSVSFTADPDYALQRYRLVVGLGASISLLYTHQRRNR